MSQPPVARASMTPAAPTARRARPPLRPALRRHQEATASVRKGRVRIARLNRPVPCAATTPPTTASMRRTHVR